MANSLRGFAALKKKDPQRMKEIAAAGGRASRRGRSSNSR